MYGVIIADDETKVRNAVKMLGHWENYGLKILREAQEGDELCRQVEELRPEIVITDMRMPGISGSDLIKKLSENYKDMKIIIISGFDDFEYTRQAITSKVVDYILKPIDEDNLNHALESAINEIEAERYQHMQNISLKIQLNEALPYVKERLFNKFVDGEDISEEEFLRLSNLSGEKNKQAYYTLAVMLVENFLQICKDTFRSNSQVCRFALQNVIDELMNGRGITFFKSERTENEIILVFYGMETKESIFLCINEIKEQLMNLFRARVFAGIGRSYNSCQDVKLSLNEARIVLLQLNILEFKRIAFYEDIVDFSSSNLADFQKYESSFLAAIENGNTAVLRQELVNLYSDVEKSGYINIRDIRKLNNDIFFLLERLIENTEEKASILQDMFKLKEVVGKELNIGALRKSMLDFIESVSSYISSKKRKKEVGTIYKIHNYIRNNYTSRFTLSELSQKFFWSEEYISKMFKEEFKCNLFDYAATLRIEKAKELLIQDKKASEIVNILGFSDESHFSKAFKKLTGMSPRVFRESYRNG